jgi:hypothetical protein
MLATAERRNKCGILPNGIDNFLTYHGGDSVAKVGDFLQIVPLAEETISGTAGLKTSAKGRGCDRPR